MAAKQIQRVDTGTSIVWLLKLDDVYLIRSRQKPTNPETGDVVFLMPFSGEWICRTEEVARAAFAEVVAISHLCETLFRQTADAEMRRLKDECHQSNAELKRVIAEKQDTPTIRGESLLQE